MFETIVWATDGSATADRALPYALKLTEDEDKHLVVVHVRELLGGRAGSYPVLADEDELLNKVETQVEEIRKTGVDAELRLATATAGGAARLVAEIAAEAGADVIVVGTRGHGPIAGALFGSVTQHLLHDARCPVLAVPPLAAETPAASEHVETTVGA
jgi:nucleotide-binding universal stress UspA family protein